MLLFMAKNKGYIKLINSEIIDIKGLGFVLAPQTSGLD